MIRKLARLGTIAAALMTIAPAILFAQPAATGDQSASPDLVVPTTKLLAIGSFTAKATPEAWKPILPSEARATAALYFNGKIDQWFVKQDQSGVVFILNVTDIKEAHEILDELPLGKAGLMEFQFIPLGPLSPLRSIMSAPTK